MKQELKSGSLLIHENVVLGMVIRDESCFLGIKCRTSELHPEIQSQSQHLLHSGAENDLIMVQKGHSINPETHQIHI